MDPAARWFLIAAFLVILYFCFRILEPFCMPVFLALILATLLYPLHNSLEKRWKGRLNLAALTVCMGLTVVLLVPFVFLLVSLARDALSIYNNLQSPETSQKLLAWLNLENPAIQKLERWLPGSWTFQDLHLGDKFRQQAEKHGLLALGMMTALVGQLFGFLMNYLIMLTTLFFLLRDGEYFAEKIRSLSPLSDKYERLFVERFRVIAQATVIGNL
ncbi:MAG TPA: AI-2E family transporter, partial [Acidobacteriota bacterium]|nr:AI-2E family transporter [Acidobacteriota bacterium]